MVLHSEIDSLAFVGVYQVMKVKPAQEEAQMRESNSKASISDGYIYGKDLWSRKICMSNAPYNGLHSCKEIPTMIYDKSA